MKHFVATDYAQKRKSLELDVISAGCAEGDKSFFGVVQCSQYSRLYYIVRGSFYILSDNGERVELLPGRVYLIPSGYSYRFGCDDEMEHLYFHIRLSDFDCLDLLGRFKRPVSMPTDSDPVKMREMLKIGGRAASIIIESEIHKALGAFAEAEKSAFDTREYSGEVSSVIDYVSDHLSVKLALSEIASAAHMAVSSMSIKFRRETGMSVGEYVDLRIMLCAERELLTTNRSVLDISDSLGFCDQFYFSRRFKEKYGLSPRDFRKKMKE